MIAPMQLRKRSSSLGLSFPNPLAWMNQKIIEWLGIPKRLGDAFNKAGAVYQNAADPNIKAAAKAAIDRIGPLVRDYDNTTSKLVFRDGALGILPVVIAVVVGVSIVSVAWAMVSIFRRTTAAENAAAAAADMAAACAAGRIDCVQAQKAIEDLGKAIEAAPEERGPIADMASAGKGLITVITIGAVAWFAFELLGPQLKAAGRRR